MSDSEIVRGKKKYWFIGAGIAFLGVAVVRIDARFLHESRAFIPLYAIGIGIAITGLVLITKGIDKQRESFRYCPHCMSLNPADATTCRKCKKPLPPVTQRRQKKGISK